MGKRKAKLASRVNPIEKKQERPNEWDHTHNEAETIKVFDETVIFDPGHVHPSGCEVEHGEEEEEARVRGGVTRILRLVWLDTHDEEDEEQHEDATQRKVDAAERQAITHKQKETKQEVKGGKPATVTPTRHSSIPIAALERVHKSVKDVPAKGKLI